jgi:hypothetical protein
MAETAAHLVEEVILLSPLTSLSWSHRISYPLQKMSLWYSGSEQARRLGGGA